MLNKPFKPMILTKSDSIPQGEFLHQFKWDGHRAIFHYDQGRKRIFTRELNECTLQYPELQEIQLPVKNCILDAECIVLDRDTSPPLPCFEQVMTRFSAKKSSTIQRLISMYPVHLAVWDIIYYNDKPLTHLKLTERLEILQNVISSNEVISITPSYENGSTLFENIVSIGGEGVVSKPKNGKYFFGIPSSTHKWFKTKNYQYEIVQIGGIRKGTFGWSLFHQGIYVGVLEFPPPSKELKAFYKISKQLIRDDNKEWIFLDPLLSCKVKFQSYTKSGKMRSPSFVEFSY
jgi:DNA ligase-1